MTAVEALVGLLAEHPLRLVGAGLGCLLLGVVAAALIGAEPAELPDTDDRPDLRIVR